QTWELPLRDRFQVGVRPRGVLSRGLSEDHLDRARLVDGTGGKDEFHATQHLIWLPMPTVECSSFPPTEGWNRHLRIGDERPKQIGLSARIEAAPISRCRCSTHNLRRRVHNEDPGRCGRRYPSPGPTLAAHPAPPAVPPSSRRNLVNSSRNSTPWCGSDRECIRTSTPTRGATVGRRLGATRRAAPSPNC